MRYLIFLFLAFAMLTCSSSTDSDSNCEVVINAQGPGFLKVVNRLNSKVEVFLTEYAFAAELNAKKCEIYGLDTGLREAEISRCADNDCGSLSDTKQIQFRIEDGATYTVEVDQNFFD